MCSLSLVLGGAASGKSALGERLCCERGGRLLYIAAMQPEGDEAAERIRRHRRLRAGKGFETLECYRDLDRAVIEGQYGAVLLECMGNLAANQMFGAHTPEDRLSGLILSGVEHVMAHTETLVVITNDIFAGSERYGGGMAAYLRCLAALNRELAARAGLVVEAVAGLPMILKGDGAFL